MELLEESKKEIKFVRIIIGNAKTGSIGVKAPTKSISVVGSSVEEMFNKILKIIKNV